MDADLTLVAKDVCDVLEIVNVGNALARLDDDEKGSIRIVDETSSSGGNPNLGIVSEPGVYRLDEDAFDSIEVTITTNDDVSIPDTIGRR